MILDIWTLIYLTAGFFSGLIDGIVGGGGLITLPVLMMGLSNPLQAIIVNKFQATLGLISSTSYLAKKGYIDFRKIYIPCIMSFIGAMIGAYIVSRVVSTDFLHVFMPIMLLLAGIYFLFSPRLCDEAHAPIISILSFSLTASLALGFYDGFFGAGTGSLFIVFFVLLLGFGAKHAAGSAKALNLSSNLGAVLIFLLLSSKNLPMIWSAAIPMTIGQVIGALLGARIVHLKGAAILKPLIVTICFVLAFKALVSATFL